MLFFERKELWFTVFAIMTLSRAGLESDALVEGPTYLP